MTVGPSSLAILRFGAFEADFRAGELREAGVRVALQDQPLHVLQMLLEHPGELVTREELRQKIWPADTFVDFEQGLYNAIRRLRATLKDSAEQPHLIETLPRRGYRFIGAVDAGSRKIESLAVLPLENLSGDPAQEYFAEGLTEALITTLAKIGDLRVVSRTSSMQYKGVRKPLPEIARELEVDAVLEGTVLRSGRRVRITAQLIDAPREAHLWADSYERDLRDVLHLQADMAQAIAREIQVKLTPIDGARLSHARVVDPEAYEAYLKGRYHWNRRPAEIGPAIQAFQDAVAKDPTYVPARAGLADCHNTLQAFGVVPAERGCVRARVLAEQALEMDPGSPEAHAALALAAMYHFEFANAEREFERAIEINPRYSPGHQLFAWFLTTQGRYEESYTEYQRAIRLDPMASVLHAMLGFAFLYARRYDRAIEQLVKTIELDPKSGPGYGALGFAYRMTGLQEQAIAKLRKAVEFWPGTTPVGMLGEAYAAAGFTAEAQASLDQLSDVVSRGGYVSPYLVARIHGTLGRIDEAFDWLETSYRQRAEWMTILKVDPCLDPLRSDPRFLDLLRRMAFTG